MSVTNISIFWESQITDTLLSSTHFMIRDSQLLQCSKKRTVHIIPIFHVDLLRCLKSWLTIHSVHTKWLFFV